MTIVPPDPAPVMTAGSIAWSFVAGLGVAAIPLTVMWVKLRLDQLSARCDVFAKVIESISDLSLDYWLLGVPREDGVAPEAGSDEAKEFAAAALKHEIRLRGSQTVLQADVERMSRDLPKARRAPLKAEFVGLIRALTGGRFGERDGYTEPHKALAAVVAAGRIIRIARDGRDDVSKPMNLLRFIFGII